MPVDQIVRASHFKLDPDIDIPLPPGDLAFRLAVRKPVRIDTLDDKPRFELAGAHQDPKEHQHVIFVIVQGAVRSAAGYA
jgi:hypothetical protein